MSCTFFISFILLTILSTFLLHHLNHFKKILTENHQAGEAEVIMDTIVGEVHQAGYIGCAHLTEHYPIFSVVFSLTADNHLVIERDKLIVRHASIQHANLIEINQPSLLVTDFGVRFKKDDLLILSDCTHAEMFIVKNVLIRHHKQILIPKEPLQGAFQPDAEVSRMVMNQYYLYKQTLLVEDIHHHREALSRNVRAFHPSISNRAMGHLKVTIDLWTGLQNETNQWHSEVWLP